MKVLYKKIEECGRKCPYYRYIRCYGNDCSHPDSPETDSGRGDELLAENKNGDFPKWCPLKEFDVMEWPRDAFESLLDYLEKEKTKACQKSFEEGYTAGYHDGSWL